MATPASSATSPSPPMAYLSHAPSTPQPMPSTSSDAQEKDNRQKAVQKFLARAEISMVTRALRARLSYASYKAAHNISHVPLRDLEAQTLQNQQASFSRTIAAKRKAAGLPSYYPTPGTPGPSTASPNTSVRRAAGSGAMLPPPSVNSPRAFFSTFPSQPTSAAHGETASSSRSGSNSAPSLYTSILAPPPTKQARTIHNVHDPPVAAPVRPAPSPRLRNTLKSPRVDHRSHAKARHSDKKKVVNSPDRRKGKRTSAADKGKRRQHVGMEVDADGDVDMKAAATLTSLLYHHRPSIGGSTSSPRSSIDGSEAGSNYSYSHFAQSSARTTTVAGPPPSSTPPSSNPAELPLRHTTPPSSSVPVAKQTTPRAVPTDKDSEAADLMLFLATSPSPARPSKARDQAAFQTLSGTSARPKGRVLFQANSVSELPTGESAGGTGSLRPPSTLSRSGEGSFVSSVSSIGSELGANQNVASAPPVQAHPPAPVLTPAQLLPPPSLSSSIPTTTSAPNETELVAGRSPKPVTPGVPADFNIHEFINASPSSPSRTLQPPKSNHGLRADIGRRLFEEEQMRQAAQAMSAVGAMTGNTEGSVGQGDEKQGITHARALGTTIDIVQS